jgi:hypothetical protein
VAISTSELIDELQALGLPDECPTETEPMRIDSDGIYHLRAVCILADIDDSVTDVDVPLWETKGKLCGSCAEPLVWQHSSVLLAASRLRNAGILANGTDVPQEALALRDDLNDCERGLVQLRDSSDSQVPELITMRESIRPRLQARIDDLTTAIRADEIRTSVAEDCAESYDKRVGKIERKAAKRAKDGKAPAKPKIGLPEAASDTVLFGVFGYRAAAQPLDPWADDDETKPTLKEDALVDTVMHAFTLHDLDGRRIAAAPAVVYNWLRLFADNPKRPWASLTASAAIDDDDDVAALTEVTLSLWDPQGGGLEDFAAAVEAGRACLLAPNA